jgi:hypothetical protein
MLKRNREKKESNHSLSRERERSEVRLWTPKKIKTKENKKCRVGERKKNKVESERERE